MAKGKVIQGKALVQLDYVIYRVTSGLFAYMLNPKMRGPNFRFISREFASMSFSFGFNPSQYSIEDTIREYSHMPYTPIESYWKKNAEQVAEHLIKGSGINENGTWDD